MVFFFFSNPSPRNFILHPKTRQKNYRILPTIIWGLSNHIDLYDLFQLSTLSDGARAAAGTRKRNRNWVLHMNKPVEILSSLMFLLAGIRMA